jgi:hypothetical protein
MWWTLSLALAADWPSIDAPLNGKVTHPNDAVVAIGLEDYLAIADVPYDHGIRIRP